MTKMKTVFHFGATLMLTSLLVSAHAQEVSIPDPGLDAAIRDTLQKPSGPLTEQDLLTLTNLNASHRNVASIEGLEAARNLVSLDLHINLLHDFSLPSELTNLSLLDVSINPLTNFFLPSGLTNLTTLILESDGFTNLVLPADLRRLSGLYLSENQFSRFDALSNLTELKYLDFTFNAFTNFSLPTGLTNLEAFRLSGNPLTNVVLPGDLSALTNLFLDQNQLTQFTLPAGLTNLLLLDLGFNQLTNVVLPADLRNLLDLLINNNQLSALDFPSNLTRLRTLYLRDNQFTNFTVPTALPGLAHLDISKNPLRDITIPPGLNQLTLLRLSEDQLTSFILPAGLTNLTMLNLSQNQLTNVVLPADLNRLETLNLGANQLTTFSVPSGLTSLTGFYVTGNVLTNLTLPPDMTEVIGFGYLGNPLTTVVLSEIQATNLAADVAFLQSQGVSVYTYPLTVQLLRPRPLVGAFQFGITGPPGVYAVLGSTNLLNWTQVGVVSNELGAISFIDTNSHLYPQRFYRGLKAPANMVFVPPSTFTMGSPTNEQDRSINEGPQTVVTLTRGYWMGKFEVTQGEYASIMGTNPSDFPGDLSRPISGMSWPDATNYCWKLTQREIAAGHIPPGSRYRLPTEAEWECAARAGTTTRFSYGDDPGNTSLTNYAWFLDFDVLDLTVHPVGQKLPNPWGMYDTYGNVWEWCQDWYGDLPGGAVTDPTGPPSNPLGFKVMRGGAFDYGQNACRSASRLFQNHNDNDLGFRVVLVIGEQ